MVSTAAAWICKREARVIDLLQLIPAILTILVLSRLVGDTPVFRFIQYLFVGISLGYALVVVYQQVLRPSVGGLVQLVDNPSVMILQLVPYVFALLLLPRITGNQAFSWLANLPLAIIFGVGAAIAFGGALVGTLFPQALATAMIPISSDPLVLVGTAVSAVGVIFVLLSFAFTTQPSTPLGRIVSASRQIGRWILFITFGFFFAGAVTTYLTALNTRLEFIFSLARGF